MRKRQTAIWIVGAMLAVSGVLWALSGGLFTASSQETAPNEVSPDSGGSARAEAFTHTPEPGSQGAESIRIPTCTLLALQEQSVASQIDGLLQDLDVTLGQHVSRGKVLARLDDSKLVPQLQLLKLRAESEAEERIARAQFKEMDAKVKYAEAANLRDPQAVPELEFKTYLAQRERFEQEIQRAREEREAACKELAKVEVLLRLHQITSALDGEVTRIFKRPGEAVKQAETLFSVAKLDRLRVEGFCKVEHASLFRPGMKVRIEPELPGSAWREFKGHTGPITDLAMHGDDGLLASSSRDGTVILWDTRNGGTRLGTLVHPSPALSVDLFPHKEGYIILTGCEDGVVRAWEWTGSRVRGPLWEQRSHDGAVHAVRIHPNGSVFVSGGDDRRIGLGDLQNGQHLGWIHHLGAWKETAHQGAITDLRFGHDMSLVSVSNDATLRVWRGTSAWDAASFALERTHRGRSGDLQRLDIRSIDKPAVLFDQGSELRLVHPATGTVRQALLGWKSTHFQGFACFAPSGRLVLTHTAEGQCQLWHAGGVLRHYQLPRACEATCGVFGAKESTFFTGGSDHVVRGWLVPEESDWAPYEASITFVGREVEPGTDLVRLHAEMANPDGPRRLRPGTYVSLVVPLTSEEATGKSSSVADVITAPAAGVGP